MAIGRTTDRAPFCPTKNMDHPTRYLPVGTPIRTMGAVVQGGPTGHSKVVKVFAPTVDYAGWLYDAQIQIKGAQMLEADTQSEAYRPMLRNTALLPAGAAMAEIFVAAGDQALKIRNITGEAPENKSYAWIMMNDGEAQALPLGDSSFPATDGATILVAGDTTEDVSVMLEWERS